MRHLENIRQIPSGWLSRISKGSQSPPLPLSNRHSLSSVCVRRGSVLFPCCFSCIKVAWPRVYRRTCLPLFRVAADTVDSRERNDTKKELSRLQQPCSSPTTSFWDVARFRYTGKLFPETMKRDQTRRSFPGKAGHSGRFPQSNRSSSSTFDRFVGHLVRGKLVNRN